MKGGEKNGKRKGKRRRGNRREREREEEGEVGRKEKRTGREGKKQVQRSERPWAPTDPRVPGCVAAPGSGERRAGLRDLLTWSYSGASASSAPRASRAPPHGRPLAPHGLPLRPGESGARAASECPARTIQARSLRPESAVRAPCPPARPPAVTSSRPCRPLAAA